MMHNSCVIKNQALMAKSKSKNIKINVAIFFMREGEVVDTDEFEVDLTSDVLTYEDLEEYCESFRAKIGIETEMHTFDHYESSKVVKIDPNFEITVHELLEKCGSLVIIIKSAIEQCRREFENRIQELQNEILRLKEVIEELKPVKDNLELFKKTSYSYGSSSLHHNRSILEKEEIESVEIDIGILFSEPLYDEETNKPTLPAVDFRSQISRLYLALESSYKPFISLRCDIATIESLKHFIKYSKPKILHIACHGNSEGNLQFEEDSRAVLGLQHLLRPEKMKTLLKNYTEILPEVVFVNSCHSEKIGRAFFELGVKYVILINSKDLISDAAAKSFSENFYRNIFKGESVPEAFESAKETVECSHTTGCCCNHTSEEPHRQNCRFKKIQRTNPKAHYDYHIPSEKCKCPMRNFNRHNLMCEWARKVLFEINDDFRYYDEFTKTWQFKKRDFPDYYDRVKKQLVICCCPVKDKKPHSESHKFKLLKKNENSNDSIFEINNNTVNPEIIDFTPPELIESHEKTPNVFGRQKQLFQFLKEVKDNRLILVYGKSGTGLTSFTIKGASYMMERRQLEFFFFMDLYDIKDKIVFGFKFNQITKLDYKNGVVNQLSIKNQKILLLLDNCDDFLENSPKQFYEEIKNLEKQIPKMRIIMTLKEQNLAAFQMQRFLCKKFQLPPLDAVFARALLNSKMKDKSHISVGFQEFRSLVSRYEVLRIPKVVESLGQSFSDTVKNKASFEQIEDKIKNINKGNTHELLRGVLQNLRESNLEAYQFLIFCSQFSEGIFLDDLKMFSSYDKKEVNLKLPIKHNWEEHYLYLFQAEVKKDADFDDMPVKVPKFENSMSEKEADNDSSEFGTEIQMKHAFSNKTDKDTIKSQPSIDKRDSYFLETLQKDKFMVKRFIRDFVWNIDKSDTTKMMKFLYLAYFSVVLELLFSILRKKNLFHEELLTYSSISKAGIFSEDTSLEHTYQVKGIDLTQSIKMAKEVFSDIQEIFMNNDGLIKKLESSDPSQFIMNHRHDFLRIYDTKWDEVYTFLQQRKQAEEKIFLCMMENILTYIPTALKIARAEDDLIYYVLTRSKSELGKLEKYTKPERSLILKLKINMIEISINFNNEKNLNTLLANGDDILKKYRMDNVLSQYTLNRIESIYEEEKKNIVLLNLLNKNSKGQGHIYEKLKEASEDLAINWQTQPLIQAKKALIIGLNYLKELGLHRPDFKLHSKKKTHKKLEDSIRDQCLRAATIFIQQDCKKMALRANLTAIELYWESEENKMSQKRKEIYDEMDKWRKVLSDCQITFLNKENKLSGFTEIDTKIKELKKNIKEWMWKSSQNNVIFMKAYPIICHDTPILVNMTRKKNNFRRQIENILSEPVKITGPLTKKPSSAFKMKDIESYRSGEDKKFCLDISAKFQIFTHKKIIQETQAGCSIMFLSADVKIKNGKCYFVSEGDLMEQSLIEINEEFARHFFYDKLFILILVGINTKAAMDKIILYNQKSPRIIALNFSPQEDYENFYVGNQVHSENVRQILIEQKQFMKAQMVYTKRFIKKIFRSQLNAGSNQKIKSIHESSFQRMLEETNCKKIDGYIHIEGLPDIYMDFREGIYRDLSPGYEGNHNIDDSYFSRRIVIRRWKKMNEVLSHLYQIVPAPKSRMSLSDSSEYVDSYEKFNSLVPERGTYINIYGDNNSGKTYFIHEIAKILIQREIYNFGVFLLDGKKIQSKFRGDFESYILKMENTKMPVLEDFEKLMGSGMILIVDDFHLIKARSDARLKIFMQKVISKKVNLILVSNTQLRNDILQIDSDGSFCPKMKKVKLDTLDELQSDLLAYNILDIQNPKQIKEYELLKAKRERNLTTREIEDILRRFNKRNLEDLKKEKDMEMKKNVSHV